MNKSKSQCPVVCYGCFGKMALCDIRRIEFIPKDFNENITQLNLAGNIIRTITKDDLPDLPNLEILDLSSNWINYIEDGAFSKYPKLNDLNLGTNQLRRITNKTFAGLPMLDKLNLGDQFLQNGASLCIDDNAFANLTYLEYLFIRGNNLKQITKYTLAGVSIRYLNLEDQDIMKFLPGAFDSLTSDSTVYFNRITDRLCCCESQRAINNTLVTFDCVKDGIIHKIGNVTCVNNSYCQENENPTTCTLNTMNINPSPAMDSSAILNQPSIKVGESGRKAETAENECKNNVYTIVFGSLGMIWAITIFVVGYLVYRQRYIQHRERIASETGVDTSDWW